MPPKDTRLIERWLPIAELGEESACERLSMTALLEVLRSLFADGYRQVMVFTQYADTMDFRREPGLGATQESGGGA